MIFTKFIPPLSSKLQNGLELLSDHLYILFYYLWGPYNDNLDSFNGYIIGPHRGSDPQRKHKLMPSNSKNFLKKKKKMKHPTCKITNSQIQTLFFSSINYIYMLCLLVITYHLYNNPCMHACIHLNQNHSDHYSPFLHTLTSFWIFYCAVCS